MACIGTNLPFCILYIISVTSKFVSHLKFFTRQILQRVFVDNIADNRHFHLLRTILFNVLLILVIRANDLHNFLDLFDKVLYMFRASPLSIIRSISTLYTCSRYLSC